MFWFHVFPCIFMSIPVFFILGPAQDGLCEAGGSAHSEHCHPVHCCGARGPVAGARWEDGEALQCSDRRLRITTSREEWRRLRPGQCDVYIECDLRFYCTCQLTTSCSVAVNVEACLWLSVLLESALWRQLQGHDPGSTPGAGQNEKPRHQTVEAADRCPHHSKLSGSLSSLRVPKKLNLLQTDSSDDVNLNALGKTETQRFCYTAVRIWWRRYSNLFVVCQSFVFVFCLWKSIRYNWWKFSQVLALNLQTSLDEYTLELWRNFISSRNQMNVKAFVYLTVPM